MPKIQSKKLKVSIAYPTSIPSFSLVPILSDFSDTIDEVFLVVNGVVSYLLSSPNLLFR